MSSAKADRSIAPANKYISRKSKAKDTKDRNVKPPVAKVTQPTKPKKGERVMEAQLAAKVLPPVIDVNPDKDPWWTDEREKAYLMTLQGLNKTQIARELQRERHTIGAWQEDERFDSRLMEENHDRFRASRQRRTIQTLHLTDKAHVLAEKMLDMAKADPKDLNSRLAARDWLNEFREQSRREDEIFGLDKQRVDVNVHGGIGVTHSSKSLGNVSFKEFLMGSMKKLGVDVENEEIDAARAEDALAAVAERALMEGTFLEELVQREKEEIAASQLLPGPSR